jgi:hypothetical protein
VSVVVYVVVKGILMVGGTSVRAVTVNEWASIRMTRTGQRAKASFAESGQCSQSEQVVGVMLVVGRSERGGISIEGMIEALI